MALDLLLKDFGCRSVGPAFSFDTVESLVSKSQPSFALIDVDLGDELLPAAECLARREVPFAFMDFGDASYSLDRSAVTRIDRGSIGRFMDPACTQPQLRFISRVCAPRSLLPTARSRKTSGWPTS